MEKTVRAFFWPWQLEEKERFLDKQSEDGWRLVRMGRLSCRFARADGARCRHRLTILPPDGDAARAAYAKQRWELAGTCGVWSCFRKAYDEKLPEASFVLPDPTAEDRIEAKFRRYMRVLVLIVACCCAVAGGCAIWAYIKKLRLWQVAFPFAAVVIACAAPYVKLEGWLERKGRLKTENEGKQRKKR